MTGSLRTRPLNLLVALNTNSLVKLARSQIFYFFPTRKESPTAAPSEDRKALDSIQEKLIAKLGVAKQAELLEKIDQLERAVLTATKAMESMSWWKAKGNGNRLRGRDFSDIYGTNGRC
ncbi:unnamed protein product [Amoebophrya sp. A25]|nr:unnamed protein product [Amoebophrya sp. A25]|eukprot:GSA25T00022549001.1